jgi:hypothetical protein
MTAMGNITNKRCWESAKGSSGYCEHSNGEELFLFGQSVKNSNLRAMNTGDTTIMAMESSGEPTESNVVENLDGSLGFHDRTFSGEF